MDNKLYIGTNTKMTKTIAQTVSFLEALDLLTADISRDDMTLFVIPSFTALESAGKAIAGKNIRLGAQNMCWEDYGQFTGEISPVMLEETGVEIIEIGHSERRHVLHETDEWINKKVLAALRHEFISLLCVGETEAQKSLGIGNETLSIQLKSDLNGVVQEDIPKLWIAYEPVWAIGEGGTPASADYADEKHAVIKSVLKELFGESGAAIPVLYGGSVNPQNASVLAQKANIDGLFVGRSAWDAPLFNTLIRQVLSVL